MPVFPRKFAFLSFPGPTGGMEGGGGRGGGGAASTTDIT